MFEAILSLVAHTKSCGSWIPGTQAAEEEIEMELSGDIVLKLFTELILTSPRNSYLLGPPIGSFSFRLREHSRVSSLGLAGATFTV